MFINNWLLYYIHKNWNDRVYATRSTRTRRSSCSALVLVAHARLDNKDYSVSKAQVCIGQKRHSQSVDPADLLYVVVRFRHHWAGNTNCSIKLVNNSAGLPVHLKAIVSKIGRQLSPFVRPGVFGDHVDYGLAGVRFMPQVWTIYWINEILTRFHWLSTIFWWDEGNEQKHIILKPIPNPYAFFLLLLSSHRRFRPSV